MTKTAKGTRTAEIYERVRREILNGTLAPGSRLKFPDFAVNYDCSVSAGREALLRLASHGLVVNTPHSGFSVTPLSEEDLDELTDARVRVECLVFALSIERGDLAWEERVVGSCHSLLRTPKFVDGSQELTDDWSIAHAAFHHALLAGCGNARLLQVAEVLRDSAELYRRWSTALGNEPDRDLDAEHSLLRDLALARDAEGGAAELGRHIRHTRDVLRKVRPFDAPAVAQAESAGQADDDRPRK